MRLTQRAEGSWPRRLTSIPVRLPFVHPWEAYLYSWSIDLWKISVHLSE
jgi:hypothetical protein